MEEQPFRFLCHELRELVRNQGLLLVQRRDLPGGSCSAFNEEVLVNCCKFTAAFKCSKTMKISQNSEGQCHLSGERVV